MVRSIMPHVTDRIMPGTHMRMVTDRLKESKEML